MDSDLKERQFALEKLNDDLRVREETWKRLEASIKDELSLRQNAATTTQRNATTTSQQHVTTAQRNAIATQPRRRLLQESRARMVPTSLIKDFTNWKLAIVATDDNMDSEMRQELIEMGEGLRQRWHHELEEQKQQHEDINYVQEATPEALARDYERWKQARKHDRNGESNAALLQEYISEGRELENRFRRIRRANKEGGWEEKVDILKILQVTTILENRLARVKQASQQHHDKGMQPRRPATEYMDLREHLKKHRAEKRYGK
jgi:hypothetical protein